LKVKEQATGIETYTEYRQDYPYTGMPLKSETRLAGAGNGSLLKQSTNTVGCKVPKTGAECVLPPDNCLLASNVAACVAFSQNRRFIYTPSSKEASWDLNGTAFPITETQTTYGINAGDNQFFGDAQLLTTANGAGGVKTTRNTFAPANISNGKWILGRLKNATVTNVANDTARLSAGTGGVGTQTPPAPPLTPAETKKLLDQLLVDDEEQY
jgi:hypothetical protein